MNLCLKRAWDGVSRVTGWGDDHSGVVELNYSKLHRLTTVSWF